METERQAELEKYAFISATTWRASATFRDDADRYRVFRDSVLAEAGLTPEQLRAFMEGSEESQQYREFARFVKYYMDSMQQSYLDSLAADTLMIDTLSDSVETPATPQP